MLNFWSLLLCAPFSSLSPRSYPVPRHAHLRPPPPHSVHRLRLGPGLRQKRFCFPRWWRRWRKRAGPSEEALGLPGGVVDQAGAALYGLPPAVAVQRLHVGLGHHHLGAGGAHPRLVLAVHRPVEEGTGEGIRNYGNLAVQDFSTANESLVFVLM